MSNPSLRFDRDFAGFAPNEVSSLWRFSLETSPAPGSSALRCSQSFQLAILRHSGILYKPGFRVYNSSVVDGAVSHIMQALSSETVDRS